MARRKATERAIAVGLSIAVHGVVLWLLASGLRRDVPPLPQEVIELTLTPPDRPLQPVERTNEPQPAVTAPTPAVTPAAPVMADTQAPSPLAVESGAPTPGPPSAPVAVAVARPPLDFTCIVEDMKTLTPNQRRKCLGQVYARPTGPSKFDPRQMIPADKRKEYDAVARRQAAIRRPHSILGNGASMGCPQANLGSGCLDDMLLPLVSTGGGGTTVGPK